MKQRNYAPLMAELAGAYARHAPASAARHTHALRHLVDGVSHGLRYVEPFPPCLTAARGAWVEDEDGHRILDFWQGHYANLLGHNPPVVTEVLARAFAGGYGLQTGLIDRAQAEAADLLCRRTGAERVRFTTSGTLATMAALMLARAFTGRELILKVGGGWHGGQPWGLKGVGFRDGFDHLDSHGLPPSVAEHVLLTRFNDPDHLHDTFRRYGDRLAAFIVEPVIGAGGMIPARRVYLQAARELTRQYGALLVFDEIITGFRFRAGDAGALYGVTPDLAAFGKTIGGGMPVAAVAGRADVLALAGRGGTVRFDGGTYAAHPAAMLAARTMLEHLVTHEADVYPVLRERAVQTRKVVTGAFAGEGIFVRFAGDRVDDLPGCSLHMPLFPYEEAADRPFDTPDEALDPRLTDRELAERVLRLALLLENVHTVHGLGATTTAHAEAELAFLGEACRRAAARIRPFLS
ncbi:aminotransferase class III-fold pyridoxal phosphate-dependent enzyme [Rhodocaloribacter litoris]|uniref:aminotransferase class III-fold pyridoxal phosphate-dependent enzyme n=1 Tax=Rhodocaloribacter litoris TaxID=2558931 RepID=UPI0014234BCF|nr:aminotransferase class III-fold pyridoxal phosphate-dependent enzyme [Rhodocaloribacter litoris]QXD16144.1 aminotransferase class III-fold pyridoxal phosphate-dependent enzyme [Rhodocaloribacter litoris]